MPESKARTEMLVGLFLLAGLGLLAGLIVTFGSFGDRFVGKYRITVIFEDAAGVIKGSDVRMGGARIGKVGSTPELTEDVRVRVELEITEGIGIPEGSVFQISSASILGDKLIGITPAPKPHQRMIEPGSVILGGGPSGLDAIQDNAVAVSREARRLLVEAEQTMKSIDGAVGDIRKVAGELQETLGKVNREILSAKNLDHFGATMANLEQASAGLEPVIDDARLAIAGVRQAADGARATLDKAGARIDELEPALKDVPAAIASLSRAADQAAAVLESVERGDGLIGTLAYDQGVSDDAKVFIRNLRRDGILRYRDKEAEGLEDDPRARFQSRRR